MAPWAVGVLVLLMVATQMREIQRQSKRIDLADDRLPIENRIKRLFDLRAQGGESAISELKTGMGSSSVLLRHEVAYVLGQMQHPSAVPSLIEILENTQEHPIVRHEAAEAIAALGVPGTEKVLEKFSVSGPPEVSDTCQLALQTLRWRFKQGHKENQTRSKHLSVDPAPPSDVRDMRKLENMLLNAKISMFDRYRAMFRLREMNCEKAVQVLGRSLNDTSAVLRHEVAFVLGQMRNPSGIEYLHDLLKNTSEHAMVRHEAAEALGSISTKKCYDILGRYRQDACRMVRESCDVALDMCRDWTLPGSER